ncbi:MAG: pitrilysin family protein [Bacteroidota bacterium]|nr:pitrilysin family protein [Bacteroidota bacterium]MDP4229756.1 pitrilysin family protein [Bacteroidota bacterium]MDP4235339.1 pitrilysin family protein [Bacteroidota bacterium]
MNTPSNIPFSEYDLANGLHVILSPSALQPIVSVNLWYHVGSKDEDPSRTGFAHLFEHLMFEGSANVKKTEHFKYIQNAGGTLNATTSFDRTNYFETLPSNQLELALWLESDRMNALDVSRENFENQRAVVKEERRQRYDNQPYGRTFETILHHLFPTSGYHWATIGSMKHLDETTIEEVQTFHKKWYLPNNASLAISGNFDTDSAKELIEKYFGDIPRGAAPARPAQPITRISGKTNVILEDAVSLPSVAIAFQGSAIYSKDDYAIDILSDCLTHGKSSRLHKSLVYEQQVAKSASAYNLSLEKSGLLFISCVAQSGVSPQNLESAIWRELGRIASEGITDIELEKAKNHNITSRAKRMQQLSSRADSLQQAYTYTGRTETANEELEMLLAVKRGDIASIAAHIMKSEEAVVLHTVPKPS